MDEWDKVVLIEENIYESSRNEGMKSAEVKFNEGVVSGYAHSFCLLYLRIIIFICHSFATGFNISIELNFMDAIIRAKLKDGDLKDRVSRKYEQILQRIASFPSEVFYIAYICIKYIHLIL
jgi:hypothetical protein